MTTDSMNQLYTAASRLQRAIRDRDAEISALRDRMLSPAEAAEIKRFIELAELHPALMCLSTAAIDRATAGAGPDAPGAVEIALAAVTSDGKARAILAVAGYGFVAEMPNHEAAVAATRIVSSALAGGTMDSAEVRVIRVLSEERLRRATGEAVELRAALGAALAGWQRRINETRRPIDEDDGKDETAAIAELQRLYDGSAANRQVSASDAPAAVRRRVAVALEAWGQRTTDDGACADNAIDHIIAAVRGTS